MDIAKYIGQFLLKNGFCYLHGLGNLQLRRTPAAYNGEALAPAQYEVVLSPGGSIDDSLAGFIAQAEQTSISKAANALRDFNTATRAELQAGREVVIPGLGTFVAAGAGAQFRTDPGFQYTPPPIPTVRSSKRTEEEPTFSAAAAAAAAAAANAAGPATSREGGIRGPSVAWGKILLLLVLIGVAVAAVVYGVKALQDRGEEDAPVRQDAPAVSTPRANSSPAASDGTTVVAPPAAVPPVPAASGRMQIVLNSYETRDRAERRVRFLSTTGLGNSATVMALDSSRHLVVIPYTGSPADTTRVLDSLSRTYGGRATMLP